MRRAGALVLCVAALVLAGGVLGGCSTDDVELTCDEIEPPEQPPNFCADEETLVRYEVAPECLDGQWTWTSEEFDCAASGEFCQDAACAMLDCSGDECAEPGDVCESDLDCLVDGRVLAECRPDEVYVVADELRCDVGAGECVPVEESVDCAARDEICSVAESGCFCASECSDELEPESTFRCEGEVIRAEVMEPVDCRCELVEVEWEDCSEDGRFCVPTEGEGPAAECVEGVDEDCGGEDCTELELPEATCDGNERVAVANFICALDQGDMPVCEPVETREDCATDGRVCVDGVCEDSDAACGEFDCTALNLPAAACDGDMLVETTAYVCDRSGASPSCVPEETRTDCAADSLTCEESAESASCV